MGVPVLYPHPDSYDLNPFMNCYPVNRVCSCDRSFIQVRMNVPVHRVCSCDKILIQVRLITPLMGAVTFPLPVSYDTVFCSWMSSRLPMTQMICGSIIINAFISMSSLALPSLSHLRGAGVLVIDHTSAVFKTRPPSFGKPMVRYWL